MLNVYIASPYNPYDPYVLEVQKKLNILRKNWLHALPLLKEDGYYGPKTAQAVRSFQQIFNILSDGKFGPQTRKLLDQKMLQLTTGPWIKAAPSLPPAPASTRATASSKRGSIYESCEFVVEKIAKNLADSITGFSEDACNQVIRLRNAKIITENDVKRIAENMIEKPNLQEMRKSIKKEVKQYLDKWYKKAQKPIASKKFKDAVIQAEEKMVLRKLKEQVVDKAIIELKSANFTRLLTTETMDAGKTKLSNTGKVLKVLSFLPLAMHICELIIKVNGGEKYDDVLKKILADIFAIVEGVILSFLIGCCIGLVGVTGGLAVVVSLALGIVLCVLLDIILPERSSVLANKLYNCIANVAQKLSANNYGVKSQHAV